MSANRPLPLAQAGLLLRRTYHQIRAMLLRGELRGGRDAMGRYYVEADAVRQYRRRTGKESRSL